MFDRGKGKRKEKKGREEKSREKNNVTRDNRTEVRVVVKDPRIVVRREVVDVLQGIPRARSSVKTSTKKARPAGGSERAKLRRRQKHKRSPTSVHT